MKHQGRDKSPDTLLDLDGEIIVVDPLGKHWVRFSVIKVEPTPEKPHGLDYSLTLHAEDGEHLVGFDNAHQVSPTKAPGSRKRTAQDHRHRFRTVRPYDYKDAASLMADFWIQVDAVLKERGVIP
jgi:hypothetical protein